ncbi:hypothetical protein GGR50DRAFT_381507 [Xylaria sp. CBS 124048]|nr:hypothetical protein GGR50DRAFT_381507 [Xylaria sp. CBS 124048]
MPPGHKESADDPIVPPDYRVHQVVSASTQLWQNLANHARYMRMGPDSIDLSRLAKLPPIPENLEGVTSIAGQATWELISRGCLSPPKARDGAKRTFKLTVPNQTICTLQDHTCFNYIDSENNGITLLFLGWSYILCASLLEKQRLPLDFLRLPRIEPPSSFREQIVVDLGDCWEDEASWWYMLLTVGVRVLPRENSRPPWTAGLLTKTEFVIQPTIMQSNLDAFQAPSSAQAAIFLARFTSLYNLESQSSLALAMALVAPALERTTLESTLDLPKPSFQKMTAQSAISSTIMRTYYKLPHYMAISLNTDFVWSALYSAFWEPDVDCNLVSPWLESMIRVIRPLVYGNMEVLGRVMAFRRPDIAPLWYGLAACGATKQIEDLFSYENWDSLYPGPMPEVAAWLGSPQSFLDLHRSGPYLREDGTITREDVWCLRHELSSQEPECHCFQQQPACPYKPFGSMVARELELPVRSHVSCVRHYWTCTRWTWFVNDEIKVVENGWNDGNEKWPNVKYEWPLNLFGKLPPVKGYTTNHRNSRKAVENIFHWAVPQMKITDKRIYTHPWVNSAAAVKEAWAKLWDATQAMIRRENGNEKTAAGIAAPDGRIDLENVEGWEERMSRYEGE